MADRVDGSYERINKVFALIALTQLTAGLGDTERRIPKRPQTLVSHNESCHAHARHGTRPKGPRGRSRVFVHAAGGYDDPGAWIAEELRRIEAVRAEIGAQASLVVDANGRFDLETGIA